MSRFQPPFEVQKPTRGKGVWLVHDQECEVFAAVDNEGRARVICENANTLAGYRPRRMVRIEHPEPLREPPRDGKQYYKVESDGGVSSDTWDNHPADWGLLRAGNIFETRANAEAAAEARTNPQAIEVGTHDPDPEV